MPFYDYRCSTCGVVFEESRSMAQADDPVTCPAGHVGATRQIAVFAAVGGAAAPAPSGGGCCGGGCCAN